jgi:hypothetical protein
VRAEEKRQGESRKDEHNADAYVNAIASTFSRMVFLSIAQTVGFTMERVVE